MCDASSTERAREEAEREYYFLQGEVGRFDALSHGIKNWSTTVSLALIAAAFYEGLPALCLVASGSAFLFWMTEARWKRYQKIHIRRLKMLEAFFRSGALPHTGPRINEAFVKILRRQGRKGICVELKLMWLANVRGPHLAIFVSGIALFMVDKFLCEIIHQPSESWIRSLLA